MNLQVDINVDDFSTTVPILVDKRMPIPGCNTEFSFSDFGVGSITELANVLGGNLAQSGIDWALTKLGIKVSVCLKESDLILIRSRLDNY